jgi:hypothetical protein
LTAWHKNQLAYKDNIIAHLKEDIKTLKHELFLASKSIKLQNEKSAETLLELPKKRLRL